MMVIIIDKDEKVVYTMQLFESCFYKSNNNTMCQRLWWVCARECGVWTIVRFLSSHPCILVWDILWRKSHESKRSYLQWHIKVMSLEGASSPSFSQKIFFIFASTMMALPK
jgi:hypothetical protein